jgi:hypothetical protein
MYLLYTERMTRHVPGVTHGRRRRGLLGGILRFVRALFLYLRDALHDDLIDVLRNGKLFLGMLLAGIGLLSFSSDRYCDGNTSSYYACTRPSTYYYYPWWAIALVIIGSFLIVLWFLRRK